MHLIPDESWSGRVRVNQLLAACGADPDLPDLEVLRLVPELLAERCRMVALSCTDTRLQLGMVNPLDHVARDDAHLVLGLEIDPVLISEEYFHRCLDRLRGRLQALSLRSAHVCARVYGSLAAVEVELSFSNPCRQISELSFAFPLPPGALLKRFEAEAGLGRLRSAVRPLEACPEADQGAWIELRPDGCLEARGLPAAPGREARIRLTYLQLLPEPTLRLPIRELLGAQLELEVWLDGIPNRVECTQPCLHQGSHLRLKAEHLKRDFTLRWESAARPRLFTEGQYFLACLPGEDPRDRGLNFLTESLAGGSRHLSGRHLGSGGLEVQGQVVPPEPVEEVGLALFWASQRPPEVPMAVQLGLLTRATALVLVDEQGQGGVRPRNARLEALVKDEPVRRVVDAILAQAVLEGATSIHLRHQENRFVISYRTCGRLHEAMAPPNSLFYPILSRLLALAGVPPDLSVPARSSLELTCHGHEVDANLYFQPWPRAQMVLTLSPRLARQLPPLGLMEGHGLVLVAAPDFRVREQLLVDIVVDLKGFSVVRSDRAPAGLTVAQPGDDLEAVIDRLDADNLLVDCLLTPELARCLLRLARRCRVVLFLRSETACLAVEELALLGDPWWAADVLQIVVTAGHQGVELRRTDEAARDCLRSANWRFRLRGAGVW